MAKERYMMTNSPIPPAGSNPPPSVDPAQGGGNPSTEAYYQSGGGWKSYEEWMGEKNYQQFMNNLLQSIVNQISIQKQKEHEVSLQLQRAEKGEDMYD
jgi:hypothetical protein